METLETLDLLIVVEESDIAKTFSISLMSAFKSVLPDLRVRKIGVCHLDMARNRYKSCTKLLFITDEGIFEIPFKKIYTWMENINGITCDATKILVVHINNKQESQDISRTENHDALFDQTRDKLEKRVVLVNNIDSYNTWSPRMIEFLFQINLNFRNKPKLTFNSGTKTTDLALTDAVQKSLKKFYGVETTKDENAFVSDNKLTDKSKRKKSNLNETSENFVAILRNAVEIYCDTKAVKHKLECKLSCKYSKRFTSCVKKKASACCTPHLLYYLFILMLLLLTVPITCIVISVFLCPVVGYILFNVFCCVKKRKVKIIISIVLSVACLCASITIGVLSYVGKVAFLIISPRYDLLIFSVTIPVYILVWGLSVLLLFFINGFSRPDLSPKMSILKKVGSWFKQRPCCFYWFVFLFCSPFIITTFMFFAFNMVVGNNCFLAAIVEHELHVLLRVIQKFNVLVQITISVVSIILGVIYIDNICLPFLLYLCVPLYSILVILPTDYIARKYLKWKYGLFSYMAC